jgi:electron transport complex protein RnfB
MSKDPEQKQSRRQMLIAALRYGALGLLGAAGGAAAIPRKKSNIQNTVWQIDPEICVACGNCATYCVLEESAVKCVHTHVMCGYCRICFGYFGPEPHDIDEGAENQLCPTGAILRKYLKDDDPYFEYTIDEPLCMGCGKCVMGCNTFGNASLFLQVRHDRCLNCNECSIAAACPSGAYKRVPADKPYLLKKVDSAE